MQLRNRTQKMRLLDKVRLREEKPFWQWLNVLLPLGLAGLWGIIYNIIRKRRFARS
jgi:ABC-2 type transport system permease protein